MSLASRRLVVCGACQRSFKRLSTHIIQSPDCHLYYSTSHCVVPERDDVRLTGVAALATGYAARPTISQSKEGEKDFIEEEDPSDDEDVAVFDDNISINEEEDKKIAAVTGDVSSEDEEMVDVDDEEEEVDVDEVLRDNDDDEVLAVDNEVSCHDDEEDVIAVEDAISSDEDEDEDDEREEITTEAGEPDTGVLELYRLLTNLRSNPLELARFSLEEQVYISLLQLLKEIKAPLNAFTRILNWAAKANDDGHQFQLDGVPTREKMIRNLFVRYNMKGLIPKEKSLYLPYSKRIVSMVYFDAREVFASLLSCPTINQDENFLFYGRDGAPFSEPPMSPNLGDIDTGLCYRRTYESLVNIPGVDMILPCILLSMDKTHIDSAGRSYADGAHNTVEWPAET